MDNKNDNQSKNLYDNLKINIVVKDPYKIDVKSMFRKGMFFDSKDVKLPEYRESQTILNILV